MDLIYWHTDLAHWHMELAHWHMELAHWHMELGGWHMDCFNTRVDIIYISTLHIKGVFLVTIDFEISEKCIFIFIFICAHMFFTWQKKKRGKILATFLHSV